jgi:hypothetical protein
MLIIIKLFVCVFQKYFYFFFLIAITVNYCKILSMNSTQFIFRLINNITIYCTTKRESQSHFQTMQISFLLFRVFNRFCEIQDIPTKKSNLTYDELRSIVAKYPDLCKCTELKVVFLPQFGKSF